MKKVKGYKFKVGDLVQIKEVIKHEEVKEYAGEIGVYTLKGSTATSYIYSIHLAIANETVGFYGDEFRKI